MYPAWGTSDLTIIIPHEAHQGKGYGTEAIRLLMDYAFGDLGFHRLVSVLWDSIQMLCDFTRKTDLRKREFRKTVITTIMNITISS